MMRPRAIGTSVLAACLAATRTHAHPGHGVAGGSWSPLHYLTEPAHGLVLLLGAAAVMLMASWARRRR